MIVWYEQIHIHKWICVEINLLVDKRNEICSTSGTITYHHWYRWCISHIFQNCSNCICTAFNDQTHDRRARVCNFEKPKKKKKTKMRETQTKHENVHAKFLITLHWVQTENSGENFQTSEAIKLTICINLLMTLHYEFQMLCVAYLFDKGSTLKSTHAHTDSIKLDFTHMDAILGLIWISPVSFEG